MDQNIHYIIEACLVIGGFLIGLIVKRAFQSIDDLWKKHDEVTRRLTELAIELPKEYVTKNDLTHAVDVIHDRFDKLELKLEKIYASSVKANPRQYSKTEG
tara:strand:+ start:168 stop:470 length:303 start_codon:yes stop_codon:yes gene_type:complete